VLGPGVGESARVAALWNATAQRADYPTVGRAVVNAAASCCHCASSMHDAGARPAPRYPPGDVAGIASIALRHRPGLK
jgi:hypothetical protein